MQKYHGQKQLEYTGPFAVVVIDTEGAYVYADAFDDDRYAVIGKNYTTLEDSKVLADKLFDAVNFRLKGRTEWEEFQGHDVWVFDSKNKCVYKANVKLR